MISTQGPKLVILELNFSDVKYDRMTSCHECRERLKPPVVLLPCNHNLCQVCCQKIFDNKSLPIKNSRNGGRRIRCPACRYEVVLDMHGVHSLPRTKFKKILLETLLEKFTLRRYIRYTDTMNVSIHKLNFTERNLVIEQIIEKMDLWQADLK